MKNGGRVPCNVTAICEMFKITCLTGKHRTKGVLKNLLKEQSFRLIQCLNIILYPRKTRRESTNLVRKYFTWHIPPIRLVRGGNLERRHYGCGPWGIGEDGRIRNPRKKTQCERGDNAQKWRKIIYPVADGTVKFSGGDQDLRTSTLIRDHPIRGEEHEDFLGESERSPPQPQDSLLDLPVKHEMISGPFLETSSTAITLNRESSSTRRENNNFLYHCYKLTSPGLLIQPWM